MVKPKKTGVVPKLRFPEFVEAGEWAEKKLGDISKFTSGGTPSKDEPSYWNGAIPWISASSMYETRIADSEHKVTPLAIGNGTRIAPKGSILVLVRGSMLFNRVPMGIAEIDVAFNQDVKALAFRVDLNVEFLLSQLMAASNRFPINETGIGAGKIDTDFLTDLRVYLPVLTEQQKIADCLTSLDELIAAQGRKVEALKTYKRGLMQQLFPREGETVPRLRFPEFRDAPGWEERTLSSICRRIMDGTHFSPKTKEGPCPYLTSKNIRNGYLDLSTVSYISEEEHREIYARCPVKKGDVLLTKDGANTGNCAINTLEYEFSLLSSVAVLCGDKAIVSQDFLYQVMVVERTQSAIINSMSGQAITRITLEKLGSYVIPLPSLAEQKRIVELLSSLDTQVAGESDILATQKSHKQALMQQLFPAVEEA